MKLATWLALFFLAVAPAAFAQVSNSDTTYTVQGATPEREAVMRRQIQVMQPAVLPYRIRFVPHWQYLNAAKIYQLHVPTGMGSKMFTHWRGNIAEFSLNLMKNGFDRYLGISDSERSNRGYVFERNWRFRFRRPVCRQTGSYRSRHEARQMVKHRHSTH